jgi:hypothetical protein
MLSRSEREAILAEGVAGIPRVAQRIGALSTAQQAKALDAAKLSYLKTLLDLGYGAVAAQKWVTAVMVELRMTMREEALSARMAMRAGVFDPIVARTTAQHRKA